MTEESHRSSAAEISVTSNGDLDQNPETVFQRVRVCLEVWYLFFKIIQMNENEFEEFFTVYHHSH